MEDLIEIRKTDCFEETRVVPHVPSSLTVGKRILILSSLLSLSLLLVLLLFVFGVQTVNRLAPLLALYSAFNGSGSVLAGALK